MVGGMDTYIEYNGEFEMAVCRICQVGVPPAYVLRHVALYHGETWKAHKVGLKRHVAAMDFIPVRDLQHPVGPREPVSGLKVVSGWCCEAEDCTAASISEKYVRKHAQKAHGWTNHREQMWFACQLQTLLGHPHIKSNLLYSEETDR